jgi:Tfp pilus assembly protein PilF
MRSLRFFLVLLFSFSCLSVHAQRTGTFGSTSSSGGRSGSRSADLQISIRYQNDRPVQSQVHVELMNSTGIKVAEAFSNADGIVSFSAVRNAYYRVRVDGSDIQETVSEPFQVMPNEGLHTEWVRVIPRNPENSNAGGTVSAQDLNVPPQARKQLDKGLDALSRGDLEHAEESLLKAVDIYPAYTRAWNNVGVVRMKAGDKAGAVEAWRKVLEIDDKFAAAYFNLARVSIAEHQVAEAERFIQKGLITDPDETSGIVLLASVYGMEEQWDKSVATARRAHGVAGSRHADAHLIAADGLLHQQMAKEAIAEYEIYLQEYPESPHAAEVRNAMATIQARSQANEPAR